MHLFGTGLAFMILGKESATLRNQMHKIARLAALTVISWRNGWVMTRHLWTAMTARVNMVPPSATVMIGAVNLQTKTVGLNAARRM
jgi:hypothetical protein